MKKRKEPGLRLLRTSDEKYNSRIDRSLQTAEYFNRRKQYKALDPILQQ